MVQEVAQADVTEVQADLADIWSEVGTVLPLSTAFGVPISPEKVKKLFDEHGEALNKFATKIRHDKAGIDICIGM